MADGTPIDLSDLTQQIKSALQQWHEPYRTDSPLMDLLIFQQARATHASADSNTRLIINQVLLDGIDNLESSQSEFAKVLKARFADDLSVQAAANRFNVVPGTIQKWQRQGWEELAEILFAKEQTAHAQTRTRLLDRLDPPTYTQLWGVDEHIQTLTNLLTDPDGPPIIAIEGIGGIGKTSLTNALMRHLIESNVIGHGEFVGCAWVTARDNLLTLGGEQKPLAQASLSGAGLVNELATQLFTDEGRPIGLEPEQLLSMIKHRLAEQPHLIVVDNLETVEDTDTLIATLRQLVNPTRILLTTRYNLFEQPDVYHYPIGELRAEDALALIRHEAKQRNLVILDSASEHELHSIYKTVGGNPLALRLVVGQTHVHALSDVLSDLAEAQGKPIENLYTYIYWHAWNSLDEPAREAWLLMPLINGEGMSVDQLADFSEMEIGDLRHALTQLVTFNLVEYSASLHESRYFIHSLTRSFLQSQVLKWGEQN